MDENYSHSICTCHFIKMALKKLIFDQKEGQNFKKSKKLPLDILEIHVSSKFGPMPIKIAACRCCYERQTSHTPIGNLTDKTLLDHPPNSMTRPKGLAYLALWARRSRPPGSLYKTIVLLPSASRR